MRFYAGPRLLVIDEVGYLPLAAEAAAALFQVITQRYLKGSIVLTTNLGIGSWGKIFDDPTVAAAMLDRLLHRSVVFNITARATACAPTAPTPRSSAGPPHELARRACLRGATALGPAVRSGPCGDGMQRRRRSHSAVVQQQRSVRRERLRSGDR